MKKRPDEVIYFIGSLAFIGRRKRSPAPASVPAAPVAAPAPAAQPNNQQLVAAIAAAIAEDMGEDVDHIKILSIRRV